MYIGQLCDDRCTSTLKAKHMKVVKQGQLVLKVNTQRGMCHVACEPHKQSTYHPKAYIPSRKKHHGQKDQARAVPVV